jgi:hypothetical protein
MSASTPAELDDALWAWAQGYLPYEAAVMFARHTDSVRLGHPLIVEDPEAPGLAAFDFGGDWESRLHHPSGGELATWRLIESMTRGLLSQEFGRLDHYRRLAFVNAMAVVWTRP